MKQPEVNNLQITNPLLLSVPFHSSQYDINFYFILCDFWDRTRMEFYLVRIMVESFQKF